MGQWPQEMNCGFDHIIEDGRRKPRVNDEKRIIFGVELDDIGYDKSLKTGRPVYIVKSSTEFVGTGSWRAGTWSVTRICGIGG